MCWKSLQKNSQNPNVASHNNAIWYTDTDGFLEHSPSGGSLYYKGPALQRIIPFFLVGGPLHTSLGSGISLSWFKIQALSLTTYVTWAGYYTSLSLSVYIYKTELFISTEWNNDTRVLNISCYIVNVQCSTKLCNSYPHYVDEDVKA